MLRKRSLLIVVLLLGLALSLAACAPQVAPSPTPTQPPPAPPTKPAEAIKPPASTPTTPPAATPTPKPATVKMGFVPTTGQVGAYVAIDKGYFREQGITMELINFPGSSQAVAPLSTGDLDVISVPVTTALLNAADRGVEMKIVAGEGQSLPKWEYIWVVLRKDLADSGTVKTPADLKGMKIAAAGAGGLGAQTVQTRIQQGGFKSGEAEMLILPYPEMTVAFANKAIAAAHVVEPWVTQMVEGGSTVKRIPNSHFFGDKLQVQVWVFGPTITKDQDLARRWMIAYIKGVRDYVKAFTTKEGRNDVINTLVKYTTVKDPKLFDVMEMPYLDSNGQMYKGSMGAQYKWLLDTGAYTGKKTLDAITDTSYVEYAAQTLGKQ